MLKKILQQSFYYLITLGFGKVISFILFALVARRVLPEQFGQITFFLSLSQLLTALSDLGLRQWYQKAMARQADERLLGRALGARLALAVVTSLIVVLINPWWPHLSWQLLIALIISLFLEALFTVGDAHFLHLRQSLKLGWKSIARSAVILGLWLLAVWLWPAMVETSFYWTYLIALAVVVVCYFPYRAIKNFSWHSIFFVDDIWRQSATYGLMDALSMGYSKADSLLVEQISGSVALANYGGAYRVLDGLNLIPQALFHNLFPAAAKKNNIKLKQVAKMMLLMGGIGLAVGSLIYFAAPLIIQLLMGPDYPAAIAVLRIFAVVNFLFFLNAPLNTIIQSSDYLKKYLPFMAGIVALNIVLNIIFINWWSINGAAWAMVVSQSCLVVVNLFFLKKIYRN